MQIIVDIILIAHEVFQINPQQWMLLQELQNIAGRLLIEVRHTQPESAVCHGWTESVRGRMSILDQW